MLRINQLAKELGVSNHDVLEAAEKKLGLTGKSHSSNLTEDQASQLRRAIEPKLAKKAKGHKGVKDAENDQGSAETLTPLAMHRPTAAVKIVKAQTAPSPAPEPTPAPVSAPVLIKKADAPKAPAQSEPEVSSPSQKPESPWQEQSRAASAAAPAVPASAPATSPELGESPVSGDVPDAPAQGGFSHIRISSSPTPTPKIQEPARYIQLPQSPQKSSTGPRPEPGARAVLQRPAQASVARSGMPQTERTVLPMASNTSRGEVRHDLPQLPAKRTFLPPSISELTPDQGFSKITLSDTPAPAPRPQTPARYIQLPQGRPTSGPSRGPSSGPSRGPAGPSRGPGGPRPSGPGGPNRGPGGPRPAYRPGGPGGANRGPGLPAAGPIDPNSQKGPGRGVHLSGKKKKGYTKDQQEMDLKLRQPRSRAQVIATEYVQEEVGIVMLSEGVSVKELAEKCNRPAKDVVAKLLHRGIFATINQPLDTELAKEIAREFGYLADIVTFEEDVQISAEEHSEVQGEKLPRPPVITIMGHVDHGKTSLLDAIRKTKVAVGEAGGITQHIGAYHVDVKDKNTGLMRQVVFLDTPGHEAFTKMRARGAKVTDIAILVVAADDGVMPQTIESINHAKAADVPLVVAINKIDKPGANADKVQQGLLQHNVQTEAYGGDVPAVAVSAKTKQGLDELLETLLLVADMKELTAVYDCPAAGSIVEARLDKGRGAVATVLVQQGTLHQGDIFVAGATMGRVRAMFNDRGERITEAGPSNAVQILGFEDVPSSGDNFQIVESENKARTIVGFRQEKAKAAALQKQRVTLENIFSTLKDGLVKELPLIIKADAQGSVESLVGQLEKLSTDKVRVRIIHAAAGTVNENDVLLAEASKAIVIAFNTKAEKKADELAHEEGVDIRFHDVIYKITEEIEAAMVGLLDATEKETIQGQAEVRQIFKVNKTIIAGSFVTEGKVQKSFKARVKRGEEVVFEGLLKSLKRFKDDVHEVKNGLDCGISLEGFDGLKEGDVIEFFTNEKVIATSLS